MDVPGRRSSDASLGATRSPAKDPSDWPPAPFAPEQVIGGVYTITRELGRGGMGVVYEARDALLDRTVAIKAPLSAGDAAALRAEAKVMAAVHHPNLVTVHTLGREGSIDFIVMERLFGMTLEQRLIEAHETGRPMPIDEALVLLIAVTEALTAVHRAGLAHRDIKAANVMLSGRRVVLTDFGLVTPEVWVRRGQPLAGSVDYVAPELIVDEVERGRGPQVDLYALGVLAFEMLAGRRPYLSDTVNDLLLAHVLELMPDVRKHRPEVPEALADLIRELVAKSPTDRPDASEGVLWRLEAIRAELAEPSAPAALTVFVVDDDPAIGRMLVRGLASFVRLSAESFTSPAVAIARIQSSPVDIVIVDLHMPDINGVELAMTVQAMPEHSRPVMIAMSAVGTDDDHAVLAGLGVHAFVAKDGLFLRTMCEIVGAIRGARRVRRTHRPLTR